LCFNGNVPPKQLVLVQEFGCGTTRRFSLREVEKRQEDRKAFFSGSPRGGRSQFNSVDNFAAGCGYWP
jgi:hypothetical protein